MVLFHRCFVFGLLACLHLETATGFQEPYSPCASPRFDAFADKLVNTWVEVRDQEALQDDPEKQQKSSTSFVVDEVMRSCGGAVQGIRDWPDHYLNRSNDGFVFFEDGSYFDGPITTAQSNDSAHEQQWIGCLQLSSDLRIVGRYGSQGEADFTLLRLRQSRYLSKPRLTCGVAGVEPSEIARLKTSYQQRCRMAKAQDPWNRVRAKWESSSKAAIPSLSLLDDDKTLTARFHIYDNMIILCASTSDWTKACIREHNSDGSLNKVVLLTSC